MSSFSTLYFPVGALIGLASAAPVGPVNLLVIQRTLTAHTAGALLLGAGGALGDSLFAAAAAFGVSAVTTLLAEHALVIRLGGGLIMLAFAVVIWRSTPKLRGDEAQASALRMALATLTLTLTNPATILFFIGAFGAVGFTGIGHDSPEHLINAAMVVAGTFSGSMLWWLAVTGVARRLRGRITDGHLVTLNKGTAIALGLFAFAAVVTGMVQR
jgi:threonine/homoserine/homoserine lactone efflux protein